MRLGTYINAPPAACVAARAAQEDPRAEPAFGERVPYVVVCGAPSEPQILTVCSATVPSCVSQDVVCCGSGPSAQLKVHLLHLHAARNMPPKHSFLGDGDSTLWP